MPITQFKCKNPTCKNFLDLENEDDWVYTLRICRGGSKFSEDRYCSTTCMKADAFWNVK